VWLEYGGDVFLQNDNWLEQDFTVLHSRTWDSFQQYSCANIWTVDSKSIEVLWVMAGNT
jgi:hypothetical protein